MTNLCIVAENQISATKKTAVKDPPLNEIVIISFSNYHGTNDAAKNYFAPKPDKLGYKV